MVGMSTLVDLKKDTPVTKQRVGDGYALRIGKWPSYVTITGMNESQIDRVVLIIQEGVEQ